MFAALQYIPIQAYSEVSRTEFRGAFSRQDKIAALVPQTFKSSKPKFYILGSTY